MTDIASEFRTLLCLHLRTTRRGMWTTPFPWPWGSWCQARVSRPVCKLYGHAASISDLKRVATLLVPGFSRSGGMVTCSRDQTADDRIHKASLMGAWKVTLGPTWCWQPLAWVRSDIFGAAFAAKGKAKTVDIRTMA